MLSLVFRGLEVEDGRPPGVLGVPGNPPVRFNPGSVCASCISAARDLHSMSPVWLWDSQPMRQALARLDPGAALAIFRAASGLSQQEVAQIMGWSQSTVSLIEKGSEIRCLTFGNCCGSPIRWICRARP